MLCLAIFIVFFSGIGEKLYKNLLYPTAYPDIISKYSYENELDKYLVMAVIKSESNFIPDAHSGKASGLMQLTDNTAEWVCRRLGIEAEEIDLFNPEDNIKLGCSYLRYLIDKYDGDTDLALAAYNAGPSNVDSWLKDNEYSKNGRDLHYIPFKETREYVKKVNKQWHKYKEFYQNGGKE